MKQTNFPNEVQLARPFLNIYMYINRFQYVPINLNAWNTYNTASVVTLGSFWLLFQGSAH